MIKIGISIQHDDPNSPCNYRGVLEVKLPDVRTAEELKQHLRDAFEAVSSPVIAQLGHGDSHDLGQRIPSVRKDQPHLLPPPVMNKPSKSISGEQKQSTEKQIAAINKICQDHHLDPAQVARDYGVNRLEDINGKDSWQFINQYARRSKS